jgi:uncharacterized integral membrane protein
MADPHIIPDMDWIDHLTVIIYRLGFTLCTPLILLLPWNIGYQIDIYLMICAIMCASSLHIYMKNFRLLLQMATWVGTIVFFLGYPEIGLGGAFITLGGLCFKEYFCFRVPGLPFQPLILAGLWFSLQFDAIAVAKILASIASLLFLTVSVAKWRMPHHFDIGDKSKYQI